MTGERLRTLAGEARPWREPSPTQPGGRAPAPGELALVQSFINSHYDLVVEHGRDLFETPAALVEWLSQRGLIAPTDTPITSGDLRRAVDLREGLRGLARANREPGCQPDRKMIARLNEAARGASVELRFGARAPRFIAVAKAPLDRALGIVLAVTARSMIDGSWSRLKACPGEDCGWAFYDHSRNQSGRWCSMAVCGGRAKARSHYRRHRQEAS